MAFKHPEKIHSTVRNMQHTNYTAESPDMKATSVERYNRTLKTRLWKYFTENKTFRYSNILLRLVKAINHTYNHTDVIGCRPVDLHKK